MSGTPDGPIDDLRFRVFTVSLRLHIRRQVSSESVVRAVGTGAAAHSVNYRLSEHRLQRNEEALRLLARRCAADEMHGDHILTERCVGLEATSRITLMIMVEGNEWYLGCVQQHSWLERYRGREEVRCQVLDCIWAFISAARKGIHVDDGSLWVIGTYSWHEDKLANKLA